MSDGIKPILESLPIISQKLEEYGFERSETFDKDFPTDKYYCLKIVAYTKKLTGRISISVTDSYDFVKAPDEWKYRTTTVELSIDQLYEEIPVTKMWELLMLSQILSPKI